MQNLVLQGFNSKTDPYGKKWEKLKDGTSFDRYSTVKKAFTYSNTPTSVTVKNELPFASYLQFGTKHIPARYMIPTQELGLGNWAIPIKEAFSSAIQDSLNGIVQKSTLPESESTGG